MATVTSYDPFSSAVLEDPYPSYRWLRTEAPCHYVAERDIWVISRYDDVVATLRSPKVFSSGEGIGYERRPTPMMIALDPPDHTRLRRMVAKQFTPRAIAEWGDRLQAIIDGLLEPILDAGTVDWVEAIAEPLPLVVIAEMLGVPPERRLDFKRWSDDVITAVGAAVRPEDEAAVERSFQELREYFVSVFEERRAEPESGRDDLITQILQPTPEGDLLTIPELVSFCILLLVAGNETTTNLIGSTVLAVADHPGEWAKVQADHSLVPSLVEEALRYDSPIQGFFRTTLMEAEVAGTTIPAGARVMELYGSANHDDSHFPEAEVFRADRNPVDHVGFGSGIHTCLGAPLARLEASLLASAILDRVGSLAVEGTAERTRNPLLRGVRRLPVSLRSK